MLISDGKKIKHVGRDGGWNTGQANKRAGLLENEALSSQIQSINYFEVTFRRTQECVLPTCDFLDSVMVPSRVPRYKIFVAWTRQGACKR